MTSAGHHTRDPRRKALTSIVISVALGCVLVLVPSLIGGQGWGADPAPPNILLVVTDDQAVESEAALPQLVEFFENGTKFTNAFATTPLCCPARASILSGRYSHNHDVRNNQETQRFNHRRTVQRELSTNGYHTGISGKFLNGWPRSKKPPHFERWALGKGYVDTRFVVDGTRRRVAYGPTFAFEQGRRFIADWEADDDTPWFLLITPHTPHGPFTPEEQYADEEFAWTGTPATAEDDRSDKPKYVRRSRASFERGMRHRERQLRALRSVDDAFAATMERIATLGELDDTIVIFTTDNGYMWADHGMMGKRAPYLGSVRVPLYVRGPLVPAGDDERLVANIDLAPSIFAWSGVVPGYVVDGKDLFVSSREHLLLEFLRDEPRRSFRPPVPRWRALVSADWHYIRYEKKHEFYDLTNDPYELENDPDLRPPHVAALLRSVAHCAGTACP